MNLTEVVPTSPPPQLSHGFDEWRTFDVTNSTTQFDNAYVWLFVCVVHWDLCYSLNPILDGIGDMWHNLDRLSQIVSSSFSLDDMLVDFAGRDAIVSSQGDVEISFIVAQIQIDLSTIIKYEAFAMLQGVHEPSITVEIRINLDRSNLKTQTLQQQSGGRRRYALTNATDDTTRHKHVLHRNNVSILSWYAVREHDNLHLDLKRTSDEEKLQQRPWRSR
jgi:hypothetical protein